MIISNIQLTNWKNFREIDVELGKRVFIIGPNASGKSNFLDAFKFLRSVSEIGLSKSVEIRGGISSVRCLSARQDPNIKITVRLDDQWLYSLAFGGKKGDSPIIKEELAKRKNINGKWDIVLFRPDDKDKMDALRLTQTAMEQISANSDFREIPDFFKTISYQHILPQVVRDPQGFTSNPVHDDPFGRDFVFRVWNTSKKIRDSRLSKINKALEIAVPQLGGLDVVLDEKTGIPHLVAKYKHWRSKAAKQDETSFSDGTLRLMALLWSIFEAKGPLLLEEPELSLHSDVILCLPSIFSRIDRTRKKESRQIIISTHSDTLLGDPGIGPGEVLILSPDSNGTNIVHANKKDKELMREGLTAADVLLPKTTPINIKQLSLIEL